MTKLTDEELSRVLSAHEAGGLRRQGGSVPGYPACIVQAAKQEFYGGDAACLMPLVTIWFDYNYRRSWTTDEFLAQLESQGLA
jgi:hypothetical protein